MVICEGFYIKGGIMKRDPLLVYHPHLPQNEFKDFVYNEKSIKLCCGFPFEIIQMSNSPLCCCPYYTDVPLQECSCTNPYCLKCRKKRLAKIKILVEDYFDDADLYMQTELLKSIEPNGYFPLTVVMKLPVIAEMRVTRRDLILACLNSAIVEIDPTYSKIRRTNLIPERPSRMFKR